MAKESRIYVKPRCLANAYEQQKQKIVERNNLELESRGLKKICQPLLIGLNQSGKGKSTREGTEKIGCGGGDEEYLPTVMEEGLIYSSEDDEPNGSQFKKDWLRDLFLKQTSTEVIPEALSNKVQIFLETPVVQKDVPGNPKRKRGPTKLKTIALDGGSRVEVKFDEEGLPIGPGSVSLSSFLGPLVREIVPFTLSDWRRLPSETTEVLWKSIQMRFKLEEEWQKEQILKQMAELWRASKSRLVKKINEAVNVEERLKLQPDNIKSVQDWKAFVEEKTSANFKKTSDKFKEMRKKQLPQTLSRRGYARLKVDMKNASTDPSSITRVDVWTRGHTKKNGEPINNDVSKTIEELKRAAIDTVMSSPTNLKEDALTKVLGPEKRGRVRGFGKGVTLSKLAILTQLNSYSTQQREENAELKEQVVHLQGMVNELMKNQRQNQTTEEELARLQGMVNELMKNQRQNQASEERRNTPIVPLSGVNANTQSNKCKLLDWMGSEEVVAEGRWSSSDPTALVHHVPIGPNAMRVWVDVARKSDIYLWRPTSDMTFIEDAIGSTVAWPSDKVIMNSILGSSN